jgi:Na+/melibiose symporter-like transporter
LCSGADDLPASDAPELPTVLAAVVRILRKALPAVAPLLRLAGKFLPYLLLGAIVAGAVVFFVDLPLFVENAHTFAAYTMFGGIIVVAVHYACYAALRADRGPRARLGFVAGYLIIALLMLLTLIIVAILQGTGNGLGLLIVEFIVIGEFAAFWLFQSVDLWELEKYQVPSLSEVLSQLGTDAQGDATQTR